MSFPFAAADAIREIRHLVEDGVDLGHDVLSIHQDGCALGRAQGHVQDGAFLREVDFVPAKHGVDLRPQARFLGQLDEECSGLVGDAIFGIIKEDARGLGRQPLSALWVLGEKLSQMEIANLFVVSLQGFPRIPLGQGLEDLLRRGRRRACCHFMLLFQRH